MKKIMIIFSTILIIQLILIGVFWIYSQPQHEPEQLDYENICKRVFNCNEDNNCSYCKDDDCRTIGTIDCNGYEIILKDS